MERRRFIQGALALVAVPCITVPLSASVIRSPVWVANGNSWRLVASLLDVKKGDIFIMSWPMRDQATSDGYTIQGTDEAIKVRFGSGQGPKCNPPYPWCNRCGEPRTVSPTEMQDVEDSKRVVCTKCIADSGYAERKLQEYREELRRNPPRMIR